MKKYLIILVLIGLFLRVYPFDARSWVMDYDTQIVSQALDLGQGIAQKDFSFWQEDIKYPYFVPYLLLLCYGVFYLFGLLFGLFSSTLQFTNFIFTHLNQFYWASRILIAFFGTLSVPLVYFTVRRICKKGALLASFLACFSLIGVQFAQQVRPHVVVAFLILLSFYLYLVFLEKKKTIWYLLLAVATGLAVGAFHSGIFAFVFLLLANYFTSRKFFNRRFFAGLLVFLITVLICYPYVFFSTVGVVGGGSGLSFSLIGATFEVNTFGLGIITILRILFLSEIALGVLLVVLLLLPKKNIFNEYFHQAAVGWWAFVAPYSFIFILLDSGERYRLLIPLILFLSVGAGILFARKFDMIKGRLKVLILLLLVFQAVQTVRLVWLMRQPYTRDQAIEWIGENIDNNDLIAFKKVFPNLIPSKKSIETQALLRDGVLSRQNQFLLSLDNDFDNSKSMIDFKSVLEYKNWNVLKAYELIKEVEPKYFVLSSRSADLDEHYSESLIAQRHGQLIKSFSPSGRELVFPSGLTNPIVDLWANERLGPTIEIYILNW